jgi:triacylglycerol esterase/lipase EstA (alpha/beta hydrolase family)
MSIFGLNSAPNHHLVTELADGRSQMIPCRKPPRHCIVFVHGFNGDALDTWKGFDSAALDDPALAETDLIFFGYDGLNSNALAASSFLFDLLDSLFTDGAAIKTLRPVKPNYQSCVLAAHSLGALFTRWALVRAYQQKLPWLNQIRYLLFAPAHSGGIIVDSVTDLLGSNPISQFIGNAAKVKIPLLQELAPGSSILRSLEDHTRTALTSGCEPLRARRVIIAEYEQIVSNLPFPGDPFPTAIRGATHTSVCKLNEYPDLLKYLKELL